MNMWHMTVLLLIKVMIHIIVMNFGMKKPQPKDITKLK